MSKALRDSYLASLGIIALTYDKAKNLSDELVKKGKLAKKKQQKFITDLLEEARKNTTELSEIVNKKIEDLAIKGEPLKQKQEKFVKDLKDKVVKTSSVTEDKIKEVVQQVVVKSKDLKDKPQELVQDLKAKAKKSDEEKVKEILEDLDIPTKEDLEEINSKLDALIKNFEKEGK